MQLFKVYSSINFDKCVHPTKHDPNQYRDHLHYPKALPTHL